MVAENFVESPWASACAAFRALHPEIRVTLTEIRASKDRVLVREWDSTKRFAEEREEKGAKRVHEVIDRIQARCPPIGRWRFQTTTTDLPANAAFVTVVDADDAVEEEAAPLCGALGFVVQSQMDTLAALPSGRHQPLMTATELLQRAAARLIQNTLLQASSFRIADMKGLFHSIDRLSGLSYERRETEARLAFVPPLPHPRIDVEFESSVPLASARSARRVLEMSRGAVQALSTDCTTLSGLRSCGNEPVALEVFFEGQRTWRVVGRPHDSAEEPRDLFIVQDGVPSVPRKALTIERFRSWLTRWLDEPNDADELWRVAEFAARAAHGTLVVFTRAAAEESRRLGHQATVFRHPVAPTPELIGGLTSVDGALIVDLGGKIHSSGVILDGLAVPPRSGTVSERPERGSRFNSAVRFVMGKAETGALVVSEDGTFDLIP